MIRVRRAFLTAAAALVLGGTSLTAQQVDRFGDWLLVQFPDQRCRLAQTVLSRRSGNELVEIWLDEEPQGTAVISARVPVGVDLAAGIAYRHPSRQTAVPLIWQMCGPDKCLAQAQITADELTRLRRGNLITLAFVPVRGSRALRVAVSLRGVTSGLRAQAACRG
ncbi:invasion associated locus B family protein [Pseudooceanicola sp. MF1-13]|uniref:invasion associated locus B family protein n=1 Tax=Pseudooceanicola sp. MF1-13 TaxID=3379095 RepID=UPI0038915C92